VRDDNVIHVDFRGARRPAKPASAAKAAATAEAEAEAAPDIDPLGDLYSLSDAGRLFGLTPQRLRYWERTGFIERSGERGGRRYYTFQDLIGLRAAKELLDGGLPLRSVRRGIEALRASLPRVARPLSSVRVVADGQSIVVRDEHDSYDAMSGQLILDFDVRSLHDDVVRVLKRATPADNHRVAYEHYMKGCRLDQREDTMAEAEAAYRRAIEVDPTFANAFTNLGNLLYRRGEIDNAERMYARALQIDNDQPEAFYNLGCLMYDRGELEAAVLNFRRALRADPSFADAHFNMAMALCDAGRHPEAREHWNSYLDLDPTSTWAEIARRHLDLDT
jgi:tetratricopeptide (TPR) repeat protein